MPLDPGKHVVIATALPCSAVGEALGISFGIEAEIQETVEDTPAGVKRRATAISADETRDASEATNAIADRTDVGDTSVAAGNEIH